MILGMVRSSHRVKVKVRLGNAIPPPLGLSETQSMHDCNCRDSKRISVTEGCRRQAAMGNSVRYISAGLYKHGHAALVPCEYSTAYGT